jgi:hypothetical protein
VPVRLFAVWLTCPPVVACRRAIRHTIDYAASRSAAAPGRRFIGPCRTAYACWTVGADGRKGKDEEEARPRPILNIYKVVIDPAGNS